jgi:hypothetical protein
MAMCDFDMCNSYHFLTVHSCQDILLENVHLGEKIARNHALKENIFMMVVCVELRIPLFLVGKPGSSKSLAKAIVADAMQGEQSKGPIFKTLKEVCEIGFVLVISLFGESPKALCSRLWKRSVKLDLFRL